MTEIGTAHLDSWPASGVTLSDVRVDDAENEIGRESRLARRKYGGKWPALAVSVLLSTASVLNDPRPLIGPRDSSVSFGAFRPTRRRISLAEARQIALETMRTAEERRARFATIEGEIFLMLYDWDRS
jgi:hypothetical protein